MLIGGLGGRYEECAATYLRAAGLAKPVVALPARCRRRLHGLGRGRPGRQPGRGPGAAQGGGPWDPPVSPWRRSPRTWAAWSPIACARAARSTAAAPGTRTSSGLCDRSRTASTTSSEARLGATTAPMPENRAPPPFRETAMAGANPIFIPGPTNVPHRIRQAIDRAHGGSAGLGPAGLHPAALRRPEADFQERERPGLPLPGLGDRRLGGGDHQHPVAGATAFWRPDSASSRTSGSTSASVTV